MTDFDPIDPYDAASVWYCFFTCDACGHVLDFTFEGEWDLRYYHELGQKAKADGWYVADRSTDHPEFVMFCPRCTVACGMMPPWDLRAAPNHMVLTICGLAGRGGEVSE